MLRNIPGGWGKESSNKPTYSDADVSEQELAAGVVTESGEIVNQSGETVGRVTEGQGKDLAGGVVKTTGDVVTQGGDVIGKAAPIEGATEKGPADAPKKGGWTVMGTVSSVGNLIGTVDNTVQTVGKLAPVAGQLSKGLPFGKGKQPQSSDVMSAAETERGAAPSVKPPTSVPAKSERGDLMSQTGRDIPEEAGKTTSQANLDVIEEGDDSQGPVSLRDNEGLPEGTEDPEAPDVTTRSNLPIPENSDLGESKSQLLDTPEEASELGNDAARSDIPVETGLTNEDQKIPGEEDADSAVSGVQDLGEDAVPEGQVPEIQEIPATESGGSKLPTEAPGTEAKDMLGSKAPSVAGTQKSGGLLSAMKSMVGGSKAPSQKSVHIPEDAVTAEMPPIEEAMEDPLAFPFEKFEGAVVGADGLIMFDDQPIGKLVEGDAENLEGMAIDAKGNIVGEKGTVLGRASLDTNIKNDLIKEAEQAVNKTIGTTVALTSPFKTFGGAVVGEDGKIIYDDKTIGKVVEGDPKELAGKQLDTKGNILNEAGSIIGRASLKTLFKDNLKTKKKFDQVTSPFEKFEGAVVGEDGKIMMDDKTIGKVVDGDAEDMVGLGVDTKGNIINEEGSIMGRASLNTSVKKEILDERRRLKKADVLTSPFERFDGAVVGSDGRIMFEDQSIGKIIEGNPAELKGMFVDTKGNIINDNGSILGKAELKPGIQEELKAAKLKKLEAFAALKGLTCNKMGNLANDKGQVIGRVVEGILKNLIGKKCDENGQFWDERGNVIGRAEPIPESEMEEFKDPSPFEDFPGATVQPNGDVVYEGQVIGKLVDGDPKKLHGKQVDPDGDILDRNGNYLGRAERWEAPEAEPEAPIDMSRLKGAKVNKMGNLVNDRGEVVGRVVEGVLANLIGKRCDENGQFWSDAGNVIGRAEPIPDGELQDFKEPGPFEDFPDAVVQANGDVVFDGEVIGKVVEGDPKKLRGKKVDPDGDILDRMGNTIGRAERWDEPEAEPEAPVDRSILAGKRVNKAGNVVDPSGVIYGRLVEGDPKRLAGRMCDREGNVRSEAGDIIGRAEVVPEGEREGFKDGPFAELQGCTVTKDGKVVTPGGDIVGRVIQGDPKILVGRTVDEDGDILDRNGNAIGKAERWEPEPEPEKPHGPMFGRRVNREGNVVDENGDIIGKLTSGDVLICSGKGIDDDGDVVNSKGQTIGHCSLLEEIPPEEEIEEGETEEERKAREDMERDQDLAKKIAYCVEQSLDQIRPICKMITEKIERAERMPKEELDEEALVKDVKPLIEEGGRILQEAHGVIRGLDPDGHIQANAKHKAGTRDATPEEYHLAEVLKELTQVVTTCIENAKKKIEGMPHAKKELNPLWGLLNEPLFQIIAAVGLLLNGVLSLVGRLLSGLGLGGLVDNLLGTLGLNRLLDSLGVGSLTGALTGKKK